MRKKRCWLIVLLGLALSRGLIYAAFVPPWQAPDEPAHFEYIWTLGHLRRIPTKEDTSAYFERELLASLYEWHYGEFVGRTLPDQMPTRTHELPRDIVVGHVRTVIGERFSLSYVLPAMILFFLRAQDLSFQLIVVRLCSVVLNVAIVWLGFLTALELASSRLSFAVLVAAIVIWMPQHTFINSTVTDGSLAEVMAGLVFYCWARIFHRRWDAWSVVGVLVGTTIGVGSKNTAAFLIPMDVALAISGLLVRPHRAWSWRHGTLMGAAAVLLAAGIWAWTRSPLGARAAQWVRLALSLPGMAWVDERGLSLWQGLLLAYDSLWAYFGWMVLPLDQRWYGAIVAISVTALCGWFVRKRPELPRWAIGMMGGAFALAAAIFVWVAFLSRQSGYYQYQGRYLFPVLVPFASLFIGGFERLFYGRAVEIALFLLLLFLVVLDTWSLVGYILPYFYP